MANYAYLTNAPGLTMPVPAGPFPALVGGVRTVELEAKYDLPLLWWAMFGVDDLRYAREADTFDPLEFDDAQEYADEVADVGDAEYPYLSTSQESAVAQLRRRRDGIISVIGTELVPVVEMFTEFTRGSLRPNVLVRTADLIGLGLSAEGFREVLAELDALVDGGTAGPWVAQVRGQLDASDADPVWILSGAGGESWPPAELAAAVPTGGRADTAVSPRPWSRIIGRRRR